MADKQLQSRVTRPPQTTFTAALLPARGRILTRPPAATGPRSPPLQPLHTGLSCSPPRPGGAGLCTWTSQRLGPERHKAPETDSLIPSTSHRARRQTTGVASRSACKLQGASTQQPRAREEVAERPRGEA